MASRLYHWRRLGEGQVVQETSDHAACTTKHVQMSDGAQLWKERRTPRRQQPILGGQAPQLSPTKPPSSTTSHPQQSPPTASLASNTPACLLPLLVTRIPALSAPLARPECHRRNEAPAGLANTLYQFWPATDPFQPPLDLDAGLDLCLPLPAALPLLLQRRSSNSSN